MKRFLIDVSAVQLFKEQYGIRTHFSNKLSLSCLKKPHVRRASERRGNQTLDASRWVGSDDTSLLMFAESWKQPARCLCVASSDISKEDGREVGLEPEGREDLGCKMPDIRESLFSEIDWHRLSISGPICVRECLYIDSAEALGLRGYRKT